MSLKSLLLWVTALTKRLRRIRKVAGSIPGRGYIDLYCVSGARRYCPVMVGVTSSQLDLPSLTPLFAACGRLQLWVSHFTTSVTLLQVAVIDPTNNGRRFSSWEHLAIEDYIYLYRCSFSAGKICGLHNMSLVCGLYEIVFYKWNIKEDDNWEFDRKKVILQSR